MSIRGVHSGGDCSGYMSFDGGDRGVAIITSSQHSVHRSFKSGSIVLRAGVKVFIPSRGLEGKCEAEEKGVVVLHAVPDSGSGYPCTEHNATQWYSGIAP
jgi:hypothetical protein